MKSIELSDILIDGRSFTIRAIVVTRGNDKVWVIAFYQVSHSFSIHIAATEITTHSKANQGLAWGNGGCDRRLYWFNCVFQDKFCWCGAGEWGKCG
jgi:hypothetical protein